MLSNLGDPMRRSTFGKDLQKSSPGEREGTNMTLFYKEMKSLVGNIKLVASAKALVAVLWEGERPNRVKLDTPKHDRRHPILIETERQLREYFAGERDRFDLPLEPRGSEFQKRVWRALKEIPFGETRSYLDVAKAIGSPQASRAVGAANGKNPLSIVVPCHRVIGTGGRLTGYAGGIETKATLLGLEARAGVRRRTGVQFPQRHNDYRASTIAK
jgi:methylated-DNA-[protein]-cysteine S-methyltransferase